MKVAAKLVPYSHTSGCHCILEFSYILPEHNTVVNTCQQLTADGMYSYYKVLELV